MPISNLLKDVFAGLSQSSRGRGGHTLRNILIGVLVTAIGRKIQQRLTAPPARSAA